ncbi:hypothetical protein FACS1894184_11120 [Clostridia bacterium]|nr:hypothetical protein FACS1894184_11120 [Clostridia bacterium]
MFKRHLTAQKWVQRHAGQGIEGAESPSQGGGTESRAHPPRVAPLLREGDSRPPPDLPRGLERRTPRPRERRPATHEEQTTNKTDKWARQ